jgi:hypothetical protein
MQLPWAEYCVMLCAEAIPAHVVLANVSSQLVGAASSDLLGAGDIEKLGVLPQSRILAVRLGAACILSFFFGSTAVGCFLACKRAVNTPVRTHIHMVCECWCSLGVDGGCCCSCRMSVAYHAVGAISAAVHVWCAGMHVYSHKWYCRLRGLQSTGLLRP